MFDSHKPHTYLAQVPLTVSPFLSIPTAVTLPYTFRSVPSSLPPSVTDAPNGEKPRFVKSASGHAAHPDDIVSACKALQEHLVKVDLEDKQRVQDWERQIKERDLAEKRRVAPGWLDRDEKLLEPTKVGVQKGPEDLLGEQSTQVPAPAMSPAREGEELDRVFGKLGVI